MSGKTKKKGRGRPTKLNQETHDKIVTALRSGAYIETAAAHAGIHKSTLYDWLKRGAEDDSGIYADFSDAVQKAMADAELRDVALIGKAAQSQWQAAAWRLERKFPDRWGRKQKHEHSGPDGGPLITKIERVIVDASNAKD